MKFSPHLGSQQASTASWRHCFMPHIFKCHFISSFAPTSSDIICSLLRLSPCWVLCLKSWSMVGVWNWQWCLSCTASELPVPGSAARAEELQRLPQSSYARVVFFPLLYWAQKSPVYVIGSTRSCGSFQYFGSTDQSLVKLHGRAV